MRFRWAWFLLSLSLAVLSCGYRERGRFAIVSANPVAIRAANALPVVGTACFGATSELGDDRVIDRAVRDALTRAPGADALVNVTIVDEGSCIKVSGVAVRMTVP